jgi:hypothetical protein
VWRSSLLIVLTACTAASGSAQRRTPPLGKEEILSVFEPFVEEASRHARAENRANAHAPVVLSAADIVAAVQRSVGLTLEHSEVSAAIQVPYTDGSPADVIHCASSHGPCRIASGAVVLRMRGLYRWQGNLVVIAAYSWPELGNEGQEHVGFVQAEFWFRRDRGQWKPVRFIELVRGSLPGAAEQR